MSDDPQSQDPPAPTADPPGDDRAQSLDDLAKRQERIENKLDELLSGGGGAKRDDGDGQDIARLVAEGVEKIEADKKAKADADEAAAADKAWREQVNKRLEAPPKEPTGKIRGAMQRWGLGIRD